MAKINKVILNEKSRFEWQAIIYQWVHSELNREILIRKLLDDVTFEKLAEEKSLSVQQVKKRFYASEVELIKHI